MIRYQSLPAALYLSRRQKMAEVLPIGSFVIIVTADLYPMNADAFHRFVPDSNFYYLTGLDQPEGIYCGFKSENGWSEALFIPESNDHSRLWEGEKYSLLQARDLSNCQEIRFLTDWKPYLTQFLPKAQQVFLNLPLYSREVPTAAERWAKEIGNLTQKPVESISHWIFEHRAQKNTEEIQAIQKALQITREAFVKTVPNLPTFRYEYEIEAELTYHFLRQGAEGHAFEPIIAGGRNACTLHYTTNHDVLRENDLVLMDFGANWGHYKADITRVVPYSGRFTQRQKEVYEAVLDVLNQSKRTLKTGMALSDWKEGANQLMQDALLRIGLLSPTSSNKAFETKKWFPHSIGHHLGLDVHDPCPSSLPIQAGMVLTCEPGIYIPQENIGIRLETDLYVTDQGIVDLGEDIPIHWEEIEQLIHL